MTILLIYLLFHHGTAGLQHNLNMMWPRSEMVGWPDCQIGPKSLQNKLFRESIHYGTVMVTNFRFSQGFEMQCWSFCDFLLSFVTLWGRWLIFLGPFLTGRFYQEWVTSTSDEDSCRVKMRAGRKGSMHPRAKFLKLFLLSVSGLSPLLVFSSGSWLNVSVKENQINDLFIIMFWARMDLALAAFCAVGWGRQSNLSY